MKKNDLLLAGFAILFSCLFYHQLPGINYLLFTLLLSFLILLCNPSNIRDPRWWYYCACTNLAALAVFFVNSDLSILACVAAWLVLGGKSVSRSNSVVAAGLFSFYSILSTPVIWITGLADSRKQEGNRTAGKWKMTWSVIAALILACFFFYLYRRSNPLFSSFTSSLDFSWFNSGWVFFTCLGLLIISGLTRGRQIGVVARMELQWAADIKPLEDEATGGKENIRIMASVLFLLLNGMLLLINSLDVTNIYIAHTLPQGITLSDFVHEAVWSTVFSILLAVTVIAWLFKGWLNFAPAGKSIRLLVYLWIVQSVVMVINTMVRNYWYIQQYQLTHLRIGVFVFLLLSLAGLILAWNKISKHQSTWGLAMRNFELWFLLLVLASPVNWDKLVTRYNIAHAKSLQALDVAYLLQLSNANLPELVDLHNKNRLTVQEKNKVRQKVLDIYYNDRFQQWPSFNKRMQDDRNALMQLKLN